MKNTLPLPTKETFEESLRRACRKYMESKKHKDGYNLHYYMGVIRSFERALIENWNCSREYTQAIIDEEMNRK